MLAQRQSESRSGYIEVKTRQKRKLTRVALTSKNQLRPALGLGRVVWSVLRVWSL